jgi:uncharacterized protein YbcV (DUF1398 family)
MENYIKMIVADIMFVETKNTDYVVKNDGVVFNDGNRFFKNDKVSFGYDDLIIKTIPELTLHGSGSWVKLTFKV